MRIARKKDFTTAIFQPCGNGYMIKVNNLLRFFDREETAKQYIASLGYQF